MWRVDSLKFLLVFLSMVPTSAFQPGCDHSVVQQRCSSTKSRLRPNHIRCPSLFPLHSLMTHIESIAATAAHSWTVESTPFMEPDLAVKVEEKFRERADVIAFRVAGGRRLLPAESSDASPGEGRRSRFVVMHPDLGLDIGTAESESCSVIRVDNVDVAASTTFPNALAMIGVDLDNVGDIVVEDSGTVYLVVDPNVAKQCLRLLSKELVGVGINLSLCEDSEFMPQGKMQDMKLSKILERQMERKKYEQGYVQFG